MPSDRYDLVVIGAGTAGCLAAYSAAKEGINKIILIDKKSKTQIGNKICGDGIGINHLTFLEDIGFPIKENNIVLNKIKTAYLVSPNTIVEDKINIEGHLAIIDRYNFGQILLKGVLEQGVKLVDNSTFKAIKRKNNEIELNINRKNGESLVIRTPLVIDCSGFHSKIRENSNFFDENYIIKNDEQYYCYREISEIENVPDKYLDSAVFEFSYEKTKGGYIWFFSRGNKQWNMGNGVPKSQSLHNTPKTIFHKYMKNRFSNYKTIHFGGGYVPTRHPLPSLVKNNIILAGDAGALVNPLHGGGLSPSLTSGFIAGKIAANLIPKNTLLEEDLWIFNKQIVEKYGFRYALLDLYRILLQNIPDKELDHAFANNYLPISKIFYAREYDLLLALSRQLGQTWNLLPNIRFNLLPKYIEQINNIMINYPNLPEKLKDWTSMYEKTYATYQNSILIKNEHK